MTQYQLQRENDVDLAFEGELLADVSSQDYPEQLRWTEIRIYRTDTNKYVVEQVGKTIVSGEYDRSNVRVATSPLEVREILQRKDKVTYLTRLALEVLQEAVEKDSALEPALVEKI